MDKIKLLWSKTNRWHRAFFVFAVVELRLFPGGQLGFQCNDPALSHPFTGDTISWKLLLVTTVFLPLAVMLTVERIYHHDKTVKHKQAMCWFKEYLYGVLINLVIVQTLKLIVGSPRPHFFDTCSPKEALTCQESEYVSSYTCTKGHWGSQSDKSFPSGHTSLAVHTGLFLAYYLHRRTTCPTTSRIIIIQILCVATAILCSVSRMTDHRHHWWDVLAGAVIAAPILLWTVYSLCGDFQCSKDSTTEDPTSIDTGAAEVPLICKETEQRYDFVSKICWTNAKMAFEMLNATPAIVFSYRWGYKVDGKWSGMIDDLLSGRADLGTNCVVSEERLGVISYTDTLAPFKVRFIFRQPPLPYVANIFSMPFSKNVWIATSVCAVLSTATLYLAAKWEAKEGKGPKQLDSVGDAMLLTFSAIGQQGCVMEPQKLSGRMMVFVLFTALMALYAAYSANIVVLLQAPSNSIRSLSQLANAKITLAAQDVDYNHFVLKMFQDPVHQLVHKRIDPVKGKKHFYDFNEGVERIRQGLFAFHAIVETVYLRIEQTFLETEKCDLMEVDFLYSFDAFVPVRKGSPYLELLKVAFKQLRESGIRSAVSKRLQVSKPHCASKMSSFSSVGLMDMKPVLIFMLYGICLSVAIAVAEIAVFNLKKQRNLNLLKKRKKRTRSQNVKKMEMNNC